MKSMRMSGFASAIRGTKRWEDAEADRKLARERRAFKRAIRPRRIVSGNAARMLNGQMARGGRSRFV